MERLVGRVKDIFGLVPEIDHQLLLEMKDICDAIRGRYKGGSVKVKPNPIEEALKDDDNQLIQLLRKQPEPVVKRIMTSLIEKTPLVETLETIFDFSDKNSQMTTKEILELIPEVSNQQVKYTLENYFGLSYSKHIRKIEDDGSIHEYRGFNGIRPI